jgi:hypothetical protein
MKGIDNRQKMIVRPRENAQKFILSSARLRKSTGRKGRPLPPRGTSSDRRNRPS